MDQVNAGGGKTGDVYWLPSHNYVGQSVNVDKRFKAHKTAGKDIRGATLLASGAPKEDLNSIEAFHIGSMQAYNKGEQHANQVRGNDLPSFQRGCDTRVPPGPPPTAPGPPPSAPGPPPSLPG